MSQLTLRRNIKTVLEDEEEDLVEFDRGICSHWVGYVEKKSVHSVTSGNYTSGLSSSGNCSTYKEGSGNSTSGLSSSGNCCTNEKMSHVSRMHNEKVLKDLEEGDLVEFDRGIFSHWGVYVGDEQIVHLVQDPTTTRGSSSSGDGCTNGSVGGNSTRGWSSSGDCCTDGSVGSNSTSGWSSSGDCCTNGIVGGNSTSGWSSSGDCCTNESVGGNSISGLSSSKKCSINGGNSSSDSSSSGNCTTSERGLVIMQSFWIVANDCKAKKNNQFDGRFKPLANAEITKRAKAEIGKQKYNVIWSNCEHFASYCRYGKSCSKQDDKVSCHTVTAEKFWTFTTVALACSVVLLIIKEWFKKK